MALEAGTKLGPYEILSPLGAGGMGEVYRAKDTKLHREVAIKVLPADVASSPERLLRFEREATTVAALNHPNIVTIHGIEESGGHRYIAMELVEGETLDRMIAPGGMPLAKIFDIAIPMADALAAAHDKGIVHRDLKPANVMVTKEGRVKVLDFGLAKLTAAGQGGSAPDDVTMSAPLTGKGMIIGTVPYMSPEQLKSDPLDHRTDLFSLGVMLYEMATGHRPFKGEKSAEVMSSILRDTPRPLHELNGALPRHLGRIIEHCLKKNPEERYQSAKDVRNELRELRKEVDSGNDFAESQPVSVQASVPPPPSSTSSASLSGSALSAPTRRGEFWIGVSVIGIILIAGFWYLRSSDNSSTSTSTRTHGVNSGAIDSLAVLPFANESGDPDAEFLGDGIAESVINSLTKNPELRVVSRNSAFRYRGHESELDEVTRELNVRSVLTGRVLKRGKRLVVSVVLEDMDNGKQLWGERFDREVKDILRIEHEIAERISEALKLSVSGTARFEPDQTETDAPEARLAYMRARYWWNKRTPQGFEESLRQYDEAIRIDPNYAHAYSGKAATYAMMAYYTHCPKDLIPLAKHAAHTAIEFAPQLAESYAILAYLQHIHERDWQGGEKNYLKAIQLDPSSATAHQWYGTFLLTSGRIDEAEAEFEEALRLDPGSLIINKEQAIPAIYRRDLKLAETRLKNALKLEKRFAPTLTWLGSICIAQDRLDEAIDIFRAVAAYSDNSAAFKGLVGYAFGLAGRRADAKRELEWLEREAAMGYVPARAIALVHAGLGDLDSAFRYFNQAVDDQAGEMSLLKIDPLYDPLRHDPRFARLLQRIGFPADPLAPVVKPWNPQPTTLAILPFQNISTDPDTDYLCNEIPANIIDKMSGLSELSVISRSGAFRFDPGKEDASSFGKTLGASVVLTGQLNARDESLSIRAELVDVRTNQQVWSKHYPRELTDIMAIESDITQNISDALRLQLTQEERSGLARSDTKHAEAHKALLEGRFWRLKFTKAGWRRALGHFQDAVRIDPKYALAYAELSKAYNGLGIWFGDMPPAEAGPKAKQAAAMAISLDDTLGEAHGALAFHRLFYQWDWSGAEEAFIRAIRLAPETGRLHLHYSILLRVTGRLSESEEKVQSALLLDPTYPMSLVDLAYLYTDLGRYAEAIVECQKALDLDPDFPPAYLALGMVDLAKGEYDEAISWFERNSSYRNRQTVDLGYLGSAYALAGKRTKAQSILAELLGITSRGRGHVDVARIQASLGDVDAAFAALERAFLERDPGLIFLRAEVLFERLHGDQRFKDLLGRMGFRPKVSPVSNDGATKNKTMLAVLPFANLSGDPEQEYFSDGMTEEMITRLGRLRPERLGVIARTSAMRYKNTDKLIDQIGRELGVDYVIEGGVRRAGRSVRINAQLIQVSDQTQLWGDSYTRDLSDVFAIQAEVAEAVAESLAVTLLPSSNATLREHVPDPRAYEEFLSGRSWDHAGTEEGWHKAIVHYERAIEIDPEYALAHAALSQTCSTLSSWTTVSPVEPLKKAKAAMNRAFELDPTLPDAHVARAYFHLLGEWDWRKVDEAFPRALAMHPTNPGMAHHWYGHYLTFAGRDDEAIEAFKAALQLDPLSPLHQACLGSAQVAAGDLESAERSMLRALDLKPDLPVAHNWLGLLRERQGRLTEAVAAWEKGADFSNDGALLSGALGYGYARLGDVDGAQRILDGLRAGKGSKQGYVSELNLARVHAGLGDSDRAFEQLEIAVGKREPWIMALKVGPGFDTIRDDPRFAALLRRIGVEP